MLRRRRRAARTTRCRPTSPPARASPTRPRSRPSATRRSATSRGGAPRSSTPAAGLLRALDLARQRVPGRPGLRRRVGRGDRPVPARLPDAGQRPPVPHRAVGRRHRRAPRRGGRRRHRVARPARRSTPPGSAGARLAEAHGDWTVANPVIGSFGTLDTDSGRPQGRRRADARRARCSPTRPTRRLLARLVAALPPRQRQLGRLRPRRVAAGQARTDARGRAATTLTLQGARRRPAVRHRRPLRGRPVRRRRSRAPTSRPPSPSRRAGAGRRRARRRR